MIMELELEPLRLPSDKERPLVIAGPCSAETEEQVMSTARNLAAKGCHIFRAGVWKPRTKPGGFEGNGEMALPWMQRVKEETGMMISTEVATPEHVEVALKYGMDILWVGARTSANPFAMQALADALQGIDIPVLVKNPVNPDLELWIGALQRLNQAGLKRLGVIHRGFSSYEKKIYRNAPMWQIPIELRRRIPGLPIICDPSHIGGRRDLIAPLCQQAMDLGFDGLIVESHCTPEKAWSDAEQQVTPDILDYILSLLVVRDHASTTEGLRFLRAQIDEIDNSLMGLLAKRFRICREIGAFKKEHNMTILQAGRYSEILEKRGAQALKYGMDILWVGARTSANPFAMQALADALQGIDIPVLVKNPVNPDLELWIGALQRLNQAGLKRLGVIHRGFSSYEKKIYRNAPMWQIPIELRRRIPGLPIICDPSHIGGRRDLIAPLCQQAMDLGFDGLIVESHCTPEKAWSDAEQQVTPDILDYILSLLVVRDHASTTEGLRFLRAQIDEIDNSLMGLLAKRFRICREIGTFKKEHNMTILQAGRYGEILEKRGAQASLCGMDANFAAQVFELIHEESVRQQLEVVNK